MRVDSDELVRGLNEPLARLYEQKDISSAIAVAQGVLALLGDVERPEPDEIVDERLIKLPNAERQDPWFQPHPWMRGERSAFELLDSNIRPIQAKLYWLQKKSRQQIAGSVHFTPNWEDHDYTRNDSFRVGIDFFLLPDGETLLVALSNRGNLRVVELHQRLSSTQHSIFSQWLDLRDTSTPEQLHTGLWNSFQIQSVNAEFYDGVSNSFNELLHHLEGIGRHHEEAKLFSSRLLGRLIFAWFLRKKNFIDEGVNYFEPQGIEPTSYYKTKLERLFFETLNLPIGDRKEHVLIDGRTALDISTPYLNGGLFSPQPSDWFDDESLTFPHGYFERLYGHFEKFNFTTDESSPDYEQVAIDPEMLGRVFESLLATQLSETGDSARKAKGAYYTPREIVAYMAKESLREYLVKAVDNHPRGLDAVSKLLDTRDQDWAIARSNSLRDIPSDLRPIMLSALDNLKAIDPACGSGAFPIGLLQLLFRTYSRLESRFDAYKTKLQIIQNNIFGVDIEPMAVEIARLRAWLSLVVEVEGKSVEPLPNLDFKFICANSLVSLDDNSTSLFVDTDLLDNLRDIRLSYFHATSPEAKRDLQLNYAALVSGDGMNDLDDLRTRQLRTFNPFDDSTPSQFFDPEQMFGVKDGFNIVLGNPPYLGEKGHKDVFRTVKDSRLGKKFSQAKMDYFYYFFHLALELAANQGVVCFITTNYYPKAPSAKLVRTEFKEKTNVLKLVDFHDLKIFQSALGQHNLITLLSKSEPNPDHLVQTCIAQRRGEADSTILNGILRWDDSATMYFSIKQSELYKGERLDISTRAGTSLDAVLDQLELSGTKLNALVNISNGLHTGADNVFVFEEIPEELSSDELVIEQYVKPLYKVSDLVRFGSKAPHKKVLYLPHAVELKHHPRLESYLLSHKEKLSSRAQIVRSKQSWFRLVWPRSQDLFEFAPKVVAPYSSRTNSFFYTDGQFYGSGDIYYLVGKGDISMRAICAILNSTVGLVWFRNRGKLKGDMIFFQGDSLGVFPIPSEVAGNRSLERLEVIVDKLQTMVATADDPHAQVNSTDYINLYEELDRIVFQMYGLTHQDIATIESEARELLMN